MIFGSIVVCIAIYLFCALSTEEKTCKCTPTESCWPPEETWNELNTTVSGRLIRSTPLAAPCHDPQYDAGACAKIQELWTDTQLHINSSSSAGQAAAVVGRGCSPFTPRNASCTLGAEVQYAVAVSSADDVVAGIRFATRHNVRLVIRNTGHDLLGKSSGYGALALWMHRLQSVDFIDEYQSPSYNGSAVKLGAGFEAIHAYELAAEKGKVVVGGQCKTVGISGGYIQGAGQSPLTSTFGMAADQALEFEVVTADGKHIVANDTANSDLFWALSGGGAGTYGVTISATMKTHDDFPVTVGQIEFEASHNVSSETFWEAVAFYHQLGPNITDAGAVLLTNITQPEHFSIAPFFAPKLSLGEAKALIQPLLAKLTDLGIPYNATFQHHPTFLEAYNAAYGNLWVGNLRFGSRLIPRSVIENEQDRYRYVSVLRGIMKEGGSFFDLVLRPPREIAGKVNNSVIPAWRDTSRLLLAVAGWDASTTAEELEQKAQKMTTWVQRLPAAYTYLNEGDPNEPNWQHVFYENNYAALRAIKDKYDPHSVFYARTAVGSEDWEEMPDGRLCAAS